MGHGLPNLVQQISIQLTVSPTPSSPDYQIVFLILQPEMTVEKHFDASKESQN